MIDDQQDDIHSLKPSFINEGFEFEGTIKANATLHIGGKVKGKIETSDINVDNTGYLEGEITVQKALIKGEANCTLNTNSLIVGSDGKLTGTITYEDLQIQKGGVISGQFKRR